MYTYTHQATMSWTLALKKLTESTVPDSQDMRRMGSPGKLMKYRNISHL